MPRVTTRSGLVTDLLPSLRPDDDTANPGIQRGRRLYELLHSTPKEKRQ